MTRRSIILAAGMLAAVATVFGQRPSDSIQIKHLGVAPLETAKGESVELDRATGDIVVTLGGKQYRIRKPDQISPQIKTRFGRGSEAHLFDYMYEIENLYTAAQPIGSFRLGVPDNERIQIAPEPKPWVHMRFASGLAWVWNGDDSDKADLLSKDKFAGPFKVTSSDLPGLIPVRFLGQAAVADVNGLSDGELLSTLSPASQQRVFQLETRQVKGVSQFTIGPAVRPQNDSEKSVVDMVVQAMSLPEFNSDRAALTLVAADPNNVFSKLPHAGQQGTAIIDAARLRMTLLKDKKETPK